MTTQQLTPYQNLLVQVVPRPIRSETEYRRALKQLDSLMAPHPDRSEAQMIELLATLIEQYEERDYPTPTLPPEKTLAELMEAREISQVDLAEATGITKQTISNIVNGRRGISKASARKFATYFRVPIDWFLDE